MEDKKIPSPIVEPKSKIHITLLGRNIPKVYAKIAFLNIINLALLLGAFYFLSRLPEEAASVKRLRSESIAAKENSDIAVVKAEIEKNSENIRLVDQAFVNDVFFYDYLTKMEELRASTVIQEFNFLVPNPVVDREKNFGLPISVVFQGSQEEINQAYQDFIKLPYLVRAVNVTLETGEQLTLRYGGFLYTHEDFNQDR